ncbi:MAG: aminopeptidase [Betaproteobacteria bacterium]|nr:aminopeptidase [Betaproteobacteria bacterium]
MLTVAMLGGCATVGFYAQAVQGHLGVLARARPIEDVVADPSTTPDLKARLALVLRIRAFASRELALPDNGSYRTYADLGRPAVVWNVFAASEFSVDARQWCFPVAGCVGYRGYFDRMAAERFAQRLQREEGLQTWVGPVPAYSTLGWFDDPVLNTFVGWPEAELARLIFHELAHQRVYLPGDTAFNESYAVAVELEGVRRWMAQAGDPAAGEANARSLARREAFFGLLLAHRERLAVLFREPLDDAVKRSRRTALDARLRTEYRAFRQAWGQPAAPDRPAVPFEGFDRWFGDGPNNAQLASVALYNEHVPAFQRMLAEAGGDLGRFHEDVAALARLQPGQRATRLRELADPGRSRGTADRTD